MNKAASNGYAQKVYGAYSKFEAVCKELGLIPPPKNDFIRFSFSENTG